MKSARVCDAAATTEPAGIELILLVGGLSSPKIPGEPEAGLFGPKTEGGDSKPPDPGTPYGVPVAPDEDVVAGGIVDEGTPVGVAGGIVNAGTFVGAAEDG